MTTGDIRIRARISLLFPSDGGRSAPVRGSYRPNHNFFGRDNRAMAVGLIDFTDDQSLSPGESVEIDITFLHWPWPASELHPGRRWLIQEGATVVGSGVVLEVID